MALLSGRHTHSPTRKPIDTRPNITSKSTNNDWKLANVHHYREQCRTNWILATDHAVLRRYIGCYVVTMGWSHQESWPFGHKGLGVRQQYICRVPFYLACFVCIFNKNGHKLDKFTA